MTALLGPDDFDLDAMLTDLAALVNVESPSLMLDQLELSASTLATMIERHLGGECALVASPAGPHVHWQGGGDPKVLILGHHDTVFPMGTLAKRPFDVTDGVATGPGVFDMLGGIVQALHGLAKIGRAGGDTSGVELLFSADEEVGSHESRELIEERVLRAATSSCWNRQPTVGVSRPGARAAAPSR